ncbi:MAG: CHAT domain-containing protein [Pseudomonadota bacterium]
MRILYLTANAQFAQPPADPAKAPDPGQEYPALDLWPELGRVTDALFDARADGRVTLEVVPEVQRSDVARYLAERQVNVLHFSGHGEKDQPLDAAPDGEREHRLILMDVEHEGMFGTYVENDWLREQLAGQGLRVIVLNCCWSAGVAEKLRGVADCIIGTTIPLRQDLAAEFSALLYRSLDKGLTLRELSELLAGESRFKDLYHFEVADPASWDQAIAPIALAERDLTPARQALGKRQELELIEQQIDGRLQVEWIKILLAAVIAVGGYLVIHHLITPNMPERFHFLGAMLEWQPLAVMTALVGNPLGRVATAGLVRMGAATTDRMLRALSLRPPADIERELATGRIAAMFEWLRHWQGKPDIKTSQGARS